MIIYLEIFKWVFLIFIFFLLFFIIYTYYYDKYIKKFRFLKIEDYIIPFLGGVIYVFITSSSVSFFITLIYILLKIFFK